MSKQIDFEWEDFNVPEEVPLSKQTGNKFNPPKKEVKKIDAKTTKSKPINRSTPSITHANGNGSIKHKTNPRTVKTSRLSKPDNKSKIDTNKTGFPIKKKTSKTEEKNFKAFQEKSKITDQDVVISFIDNGIKKIKECLEEMINLQEEAKQFFSAKF